LLRWLKREKHSKSESLLTIRYATPVNHHQSYDPEEEPGLGVALAESYNMVLMCTDEKAKSWSAGDWGSFIVDNGHEDDGGEDGQGDGLERLLPASLV
jgi:hypothetical protein